MAYIFRYGGGGSEYLLNERYARRFGNTETCRAGNYGMHVFALEHTGCGAQLLGGLFTHF